MKLAGQNLPVSPCIPDEETRLLRAKLIMEEALETIEALGFAVICFGECNFDDGVKLDNFEFRPERFNCGESRQCVPIIPNLELIADGCADLSVVAIGTLSACGISDKPLLMEVDESNLRKFGEGSYKREDGKWMKPKDWQPPNITKVLEEQGS